ncbi:MAG: hypothetical protein IPM42_10040 [Saprospiraceae bacterium]|nr:hypothetical protein [Saprospiraceae bacterium]
MYRSIANFVSIIFHPLFVISYVFSFLMVANPWLFGYNDDKSKGLLIISVLTLSVMFPLISIFMMRALGLISGLKMADKKERIGPLIATGLFYLWLYVNIRKNDMVPEAFSFFLLGTVIALFMGLFLNSFTKISLHTIGAGGFLAGVFLIGYNFTYGRFEVFLPFIRKLYIVSTDLVILVVILIAGLVGTSRLYLKVHSEDEIYGGYMVGIIAQILAYRIFF